MAVVGLHHVLLTVSNLQKSTTFYSDLLGLRKVKASPTTASPAPKFCTRYPTAASSGWSNTKPPPTNHSTKPTPDSTTSL